MKFSYLIEHIIRNKPIPGIIPYVSSREPSLTLGLHWVLLLSILTATWTSECPTQLKSSLVYIPLCNICMLSNIDPPRSASDQPHTPLQSQHMLSKQGLAEAGSMLNCRETASRRISLSFQSPLYKGDLIIVHSKGSYDSMFIILHIILFFTSQWLKLDTTFL